MIIGSAAIKHFYSDFPRKSKDIDIVEDGNSSLNKEFIKKDSLIKKLNSY